MKRGNGNAPPAHQLVDRAVENRYYDILELPYEGHRYALGESDSLYFDSRRKHPSVNYPTEPAVLATVNHNYRPL
jgi:hypothetical protein